MRPISLKIEQEDVLRPLKNSSKTNRRSHSFVKSALNFASLVLIIIFCYALLAESDFLLKNARHAPMEILLNSLTNNQAQMNETQSSSVLNQSSSSITSLSSSPSSSSSSSSSLASIPRASTCQADTLAYKEVRCPVWNPSGPNPLAEDSHIDHRVRYIYAHQHPASCATSNYIIGGYQESLGFGAQIRGFTGPMFSLGLQSNRVNLIHPEDFIYGGCANKSWTCYFEPISNCSYQRHVKPLVDKDGLVKTDKNDAWKNASIRVVTNPWFGVGWWHHREGTTYKDTFQWTFDDQQAGIYLYMFRLNALTKKRVEDVLNDALPCDLNPSRTISLPIRASDKCIGKYNLRSAMGAELIRKNDPLVDTIILTSEDRRFVEARHNYTDETGSTADEKKEEDNSSWKAEQDSEGKRSEVKKRRRNGERQKGKPWRFIMNPMDVMQASGHAGNMLRYNYTMDDVFMSFFTSMQLQMRAKYFILNCVSNFHQVMKFLIENGGCSFIPHPVVICMNEQHGLYRICSRFKDNDWKDCLVKKRQEILMAGDEVTEDFDETVTLAVKTEEANQRKREEGAKKRKEEEEKKKKEAEEKDRKEEEEKKKKKVEETKKKEEEQKKKKEEQEAKRKEEEQKDQEEKAKKEKDRKGEEEEANKKKTEGEEKKKKEGQRDKEGEDLKRKEEKAKKQMKEDEERQEEGKNKKKKKEEEEVRGDQEENKTNKRKKKEASEEESVTKERAADEKVEETRETEEPSSSLQRKRRRLKEEKEVDRFKRKLFSYLR